ncbi:hypothetical protein HGRIS_005282 [Hohenbuehelia grisea]|uniref:DUF3533 domain-containing protein n=1 Tax=Hohenbuehelia grisea TaxID=104357 RepID=A0ABR3JFJ1_9AGAR
MSSPPRRSSRPHSADSNETVHDAHPPPAPFTGGFFDKSPEAARARAAYFEVIIGGLVLLTITIFGTLSIYWGALWKTDQHISNLKGWIVDFDGGIIGETVVETFTGLRGEPMKITWEVHPASSFPDGPSDVANAVINEKCWVALAVSAGATARLNAAAGAMNSSYDGTTAITALAVEARNEDGYRSLVKPNIDIPMDRLAFAFANQFLRNLTTNGQTNLTALVSNAPQIITRPVYFTLDNLRPFDVPVASAVTFVGLIYLLIISFIVALISTGARAAAGLDRRLSLRSLIAIRLTTSVTMYFILSLFYSLQSMAFQLPFDRKFGRAGFLVFWMIEWLGMTALGLAIEAMLTLLTPRFIPFFLVLWIISNVSTCFYPLESLPGFYRYGYATPFYNISRTVRTIVFSTHNEGTCAFAWTISSEYQLRLRLVGLNFGVLIVWIAISCITLPLFQWLSRSREVKAMRSQGQPLATAAQADRSESQTSHNTPRSEKSSR